MKELIRKHQISFKNAFSGLVWALVSQPNFKIHLFLSFLVVIAGWYFQIAAYEWLIIVFTIFLGMAGEMVNTALEAMTDLITKEWRQEAKIAKDVSAGMMLLIAFASIVIAAIIFLPKILNIL